MSEYSILIVDDEEIVRVALEAFLEDEGYKISSAISGEEALEVMKKTSFNLGIIDMRLPGIDGDTLIMKAKRLQPDMKFIIHTGSMGYSISDTLVNAGISDRDVFKKPVKDMKKFLQIIRLHLE